MDYNERSNILPKIIIKDNLPRKINYILLFITNIGILCFGIYISLIYYDNFKKKGSECSNIYLLQGLSTINSLLIILSLRSFTYFYIIGLASSSGLICYNLYNIFTIDNQCQKFYQDKYFLLWLFYIICIISQLMNMFFFYTDAMINIILSKIQLILDLEYIYKEKINNTNSNLYDNTDDQLYQNIYENEEEE